MSKFYRWIALILGLQLITITALAAPKAQWVLATPAEASPVKVVSLDGEVWVGRRSFPARLGLSCRAGSPPLQMVLRVPQHTKLWDAKPFMRGGDSPKSQLKVALGGLRQTEDSVFSGLAQDKQYFAFSWHSHGRFIQRQSATHKLLRIEISGAKRQDGRLAAEFHLPEVRTALLEAVQACLPGLGQ
ncbi:hypothetical protein HZU77_001840 [Neisseriaceae bacterium TC5R-5]|nr:hypothetical protein [Neisseriaceae bacterium TC5R-5]